jgi:hypothetical protein
VLSRHRNSITAACARRRMPRVRSPCVAPGLCVVP